MTNPSPHFELIEGDQPGWESLWTTEQLSRQVNILHNRLQDVSEISSPAEARARAILMAELGDDFRDTYFRTDEHTDRLSALDCYGVALQLSGKNSWTMAQLHFNRAKLFAHDFKQHGGFDRELEHDLYQVEAWVMKLGSLKERRSGKELLKSIAQMGQEAGIGMTAEYPKGFAETEAAVYESMFVNRMSRIAEGAGRLHDTVEMVAAPEPAGEQPAGDLVPAVSPAS